MLLSQALRMRKFRPGIKDVLYILNRLSNNLSAIDISEIDNPAYIGRVELTDRPEDLAFDFTGSSYGPLFSGLYNYNAVVYVGQDVDAPNDVAMSVFDISNIGAAIIEPAVNNEYQDSSGLLSVRYIGLDAPRQYLFGSYNASPNGIFALDTWGSTFVDGSGTEGMNVSQLLYASSVPAVNNSSRDVTDVVYDPSSQILYVGAEYDSGIPQTEIIAVDCSTASSLSILSYYGDSDTDNGPQCLEYHKGDFVDWLYVGTGNNKILKIDAGNPSSLSLNSNVTLTSEPRHINIPTDSFNYIFVGGRSGYVYSIGNAKSGGSLSLVDSLLIAGAGTITCLTSTTPTEYGSRYIFAADNNNKIYVISVDGSGNLSLYTTWEYTDISGMPSDSLDSPVRLQYQSLV